MNFDVLDRARGVLVGQAVGDALGVPYEFAAPPPPGRPARMTGGGLGDYEPGEWSDDTQLTVCVARAFADGPGPRDPATLDAIAAGFEGWFAADPADVGVQTREVIADAARRDGTPAQRLCAAARALHERTGHTAGNGALMRTSVVGLGVLGNAFATARLARSIAELTHADPLAAESCILWSEAVRIAVAERRLDVRAGLELIGPERARQWSRWIDEAEHASTDRLRNNGFTVTAFQAAWHAIATTPGNDLAASLHAAVRIGGDTDTVAAIAGGLLGGYWGVSAIPTEWREAVHGWPGLRAVDLERYATAIVES